MKYLLTQSVIFLSTVGALLYFFSLDYFVPIDSQGNPNWYTVLIVLFLLFLFAQSLISLTVFIIQKLVAFGPKEFPNYRVSLRWGLGIGVGIVTVLLLNTLNLVAIEWGIAFLLLVIIALVVI